MDGLSTQAAEASRARRVTFSPSSGQTRSASSRQVLASFARLPARCRSAASRRTATAHGGDCGPAAAGEPGSGAAPSRWRAIRVTSAPSW